MLIVFLIALVLHIGAIQFSKFAGFSRPISDEVSVYASIDIMLSFIVTFIALAQFPSLRHNASIIFRSNYSRIFERGKIILLLFVGLAAYEAYISLQLILSGVLRHTLLQEFDRGGLSYMAVSAFFKLLFPMVMFFGATLSVKLIALMGLMFSIVITASRSELTYVINFFIVLLLFASRKELVSKLPRLAILALSMLLVAIFATSLLQNRPISKGINSVVDITRSKLKYHAYGYYLAEEAIRDGAHAEKVLFPFGGYFSEYFIRGYASSVALDSDYVAYSHNLGTDKNTGNPMLANVIYPWWSWFVGAFGVAGLIIKALFVYTLLLVCFSARLMFTSVLLLSFVLLGSSAAHPLMTLTHTFGFFMALAVDILVLVSAKFSFRWRIREPWAASSDSRHAV